MRYRELGKTGLKVSEIGLGGEWLERHSAEEVHEIISFCEKQGINILDCFMSEPNVRSNIGAAIEGHREKWIIQGHIGSIWENGQYTRTRDMKKVIPAFEDLLLRLRTDYIDLGMIHYIDEPAEFHRVMEGDFFSYIEQLKARKIIRHIGLSTHNPEVASFAVQSKKIEVILFSINPAFDMLPPTENLEDYYSLHTYQNHQELRGIAPERVELYKNCEKAGVGITVMKGYGGGRLFSEQTSPFGVSLTPVQCLHYALTRPAVSSVMAGFDSVRQVKEAVAYETASEEAQDYATVLSQAPAHAYYGQCTYCGHCAPCPAGIDIAMVNKLYDLAVMQSQVPDSVKEHYHALSASGKDCIVCKSCEKRCPFGVPIAERMKEANRLFG